ncbi:MAG: DUF6680 family protein [Methyloligella sp. ZOD6]
MTTGELTIAVATILAIVVGPVIAVWITRINDDNRADRARKLDIFRTLMRTRRMPVHIEHVGALNLVEIEFIDHPNVVKAWKDYLNILSEKMPPIEEKDRFDSALKKRDTLLTKLIYEISQALGIKVEQLDILEGNYVPQGWSDDDWEQRLVRRGLIALLSGRQPLYVQPQGSSNQPGVYPPPPDEEQD